MKKVKKNVLYYENTMLCYVLIIKDWKGERLYTYDTYKEGIEWLKIYEKEWFEKYYSTEPIKPQ